MPSAALRLPALLFVAGAIALQLLTILSGAVSGAPMNKVFYLQASTTSIRGASDAMPSPAARWTYFALCGMENGHNADCGGVKPAIPFDPVRNFGTERGVPDALVGTSKFFYLSRVAWAFALIALLVAGGALVMGAVAACVRLGAGLAAGLAGVALVCQGLAAALMTAWTIQGRNAFRKDGTEAKIGVWAYGFVWGAVGCLLLATVLFVVGKGKKGGKKGKRSEGSGGLKDGEEERR